MPLWERLHIDWTMALLIVLFAAIAIIPIWRWL
jgi:hypothetical protein